MKYLCYYDIKKYSDEERNYALAATNKMDYIISALNRNGIKVELISASRCSKKNTKGKGRFEKIYNENSLKMFFSIGGNKIVRGIDKIHHTLLFFFWCVFNIKKNEIVFCYHSLIYYKIILLLKKLKKFKLVLEVEEIYADVIGNAVLKKRELKYLEIADAYIFPTELLNKKINSLKKPFLIIHGTYKVETNNNKKNEDNNIHIVYAGTFDPRKQGAIATVTLASFLPKTYHIHIIGFGTDKDTNDLKKLIEKTNKTSEAKVTFDGLKSGDEYIRFLQSCDIGLSVQNPDAEFNDTSFPSKILSYMANGLRVVSIKIPAVETSKIGKYLYYYDKQESQIIAQTIMKINFKEKYDSRKVISRLDKAFVKNISIFLKELE